MNQLFIVLSLEDYMLPCMTKKLLNFDCPGCGLQRSVVFLLKGDFVAAFYMYPAVYAIISLFGFLVLNHYIKISHSNKITLALMALSVILILGNYILKFI